MSPREWRQSLLDETLEGRLANAGCPCSLAVALATAQQSHGPLKEWARSSLANGLMLRTSQAEHIASGDSLVETAKATGTDVTFVLATLTRFEIEMTDAEELYTCNVSCFFCAEPVDPLARDTYRRVTGWERKALGESRKSGSDIVLRTAGEELAHSGCILLVKQGVAIGQASLL